MTNRRNGRWLVALGLLLATSAWGGEREDLEQLRATTVNLIQMLVEEGVLTRDKAQDLLQRAQVRSPDTPAAPGTKGDGKKVVRVPYVPEVVRNEIREQIKQEVIAQSKLERWGDPGAVPSWLDRIQFEGDVRLRYQADRFGDDNVPAAFLLAQGQQIDNTTENRDRLRVRARLSALARLNDWVGAGLRLTTGSQGDAVSTSQTLGTTSTKYSASFDRAFMKLQPLEWLSLSGGRFANPYFSTDLVFHDDLGFEGLAATLRPFLKHEHAFRPFLPLGAFPVQEVELSNRDKWMYGAQGGFEWDAAERVRTRLGLAVYDYRNLAGKPNQPFSNLTDYSAPQFRQKGNSLFDIGNPNNGTWALAADFREVNLTAQAAFTHFDPVHVVLTADYVKNVGFDRNEIRNRTGLDIEPKTTGYQARVMLGMPRMGAIGDWQVHWGYRYLERDAVVDAFTTSDFHLGGTNHKGYSLGGSYGVGRNTWLSMRWMTSEQIDGPPLKIDVLQLDLNARF